MSGKNPADASDSVTVKVGPTSVDLSVKGKTASRATEVLLDLISPFTNAAGWVGDRLSDARRLAAIRAAAKAAEMLKTEGISRASIPPKVLLPWLDGASLETEGEESLTDAWAGLFVRAAKSSDAVTISYIETLKKLGKEEAELLEFFATDTSPSYSRKFYEQDEPHIFSEQNPLLPNVVKPIEAAIENGTVADLANCMNDLGIQGMRQIIFFSFGNLEMVPTKFFQSHEHVISNLEHLGLISVKSGKINTKFGDVEIIWFEITKYAFDMIWACQGVLTGSPKSGGWVRNRANARTTSRKKRNAA